MPTAAAATIAATTASTAAAAAPFRFGPGFIDCKIAPFYGIPV